MIKMKFIFPLALAVLIVLPFACADLITPTVTKVYFEKDGQPINTPVSFNVNCFGYAWQPGPSPQKEPGTYTPAKVFSFSANIQNYGDDIFQNYYMNYRHIDYCDIEGRADGESFSIQKYSIDPINFSKCEEGGFNETDVDGHPLELKCELRVDIVRDKSIVFPTSNPNPSPEPEQKGFWQSISCFFIRLFGGSC